MNIPSRLNNLHSFYGKAKYAFLAVFALTIMFSAFVSHRVYGDSVVGTVETKLMLEIDGKTKDITTTQNTISGALVQNNILMSEYDITVPPLDTYLSGKTIGVQIVRAIPVLISDNGQTWPAFSAYVDPSDILKQLKVEVFPEDKVSAELIMDPAVEGAIGQKIIIQRAPVYAIYVDDTTKVARSWAVNVGDLLAEKGITLGVNDIVKPGKTAILTGVSEITVTRINYADVDETVTVPFETIYRIDTSLGLSQSRVAQVGVSGKVNKSYRVVYENGVEVSRNLTNSEIVVDMQNMIIYKGAEVGRANWGFYSGLSTAYKGRRGTILKVTNLNNGIAINVKVVDYGPTGALLDLGRDAFIALGGNPDDGYMSNIAVQLVE